MSLMGSFICLGVSLLLNLSVWLCSTQNILVYWWLLHELSPKQQLLMMFFTMVWNPLKNPKAKFIRMVEYFKCRTSQVWFTPPNCSNSNMLLSYFATAFIFELQKTDFKIFVVGEIMSLFGYYWTLKMAWLIV